MSWTVPTGCYYAVAEDDPQWHFVYYSAGTTVPTEHAPNNPYVDVRDIQNFVLIDFTNGYIYADVEYCTITIKSNNTFTAEYDGLVTGVTHTNIFASNDALADYKLTLAGVAFNFGNGSGMRNKSALLHSSRSYKMRFSFVGRSITSVTIPNGIDSLWHAFDGCTSLTTVSTIPSAVTDMGYCFRDCTSLTTAPTIPSAVTRMAYCFQGCTSLITAPTIPSSVVYLSYCFKNCTSLEGAVTINASPSNITEVFANTVNDIVLFGAGSLESIAESYENVYVWFLTTTMTASRDEAQTTTVDISVDVSRFKTGTLASLTLSKDGTTQAVTWNDPSFAVTDIPTTFTTSLTNIGESTTPLLSVVATDAYGSSTVTSVRIPVAFYTIDVQAGGKEIAFGAPANDDLTNYPNGLFKCAMDAWFMGSANGGLIGEIKMYAGASAPSGWLFCDGSEISRTTYAKLYDVIGTTYGAGDGSTTFKIPDMRGRAVIGVNNSTLPNGQNSTYSLRNRGVSGGSETVALNDVKYLPAHTHGEKSLTGYIQFRRYGGTANTGTITTATGGIVSASSVANQTNYANVAIQTNVTSTNHSRQTINATHTHNSVGSGTAHENMPPFYAVHYIIFTGKF